MIAAIPAILLVLTPIISAGAIKAQGQFTPSHQSALAGNRWYTPYGNTAKLSTKRNTPLLQRQGRQYENDAVPAAPGPETVDLHKGEFCVDVSTYSPIKYDHVPKDVCDSTFAKQCENRYEEVCDDVTEIVCEIVPYTECEMIMENVPYRSFEVIQQFYKKKVCSAGMDIVKHTKMMPECRNVTKQNCITKWETDANGKQVWAGNEACEPVTWRECKLVPKQVDFKVPKITCDDGEDVPYDDYVDVEKDQMTAKMVCEVKHTSSCQPKVTNKCANIQFQECNEIPNENCETKDVKVPKQEKEHKKKCLLADDNDLPSTPAPPAAYPTPTPTVYTNPPSVDTNVLSQPAPAAPKPTYQTSSPQPTYPEPSSTYGVPRGARITSQTFGTRQPKSSFNRRPATTFRQPPQNQGFLGRFQG